MPASHTRWWRLGVHSVNYKSKSHSHNSTPEINPPANKSNPADNLLYCRAHLTMFLCRKRSVMVLISIGGFGCLEIILARATAPWGLFIISVCSRNMKSGTCPVAPLYFMSSSKSPFSASETTTWGSQTSQTRTRQIKKQKNRVNKRVELQEGRNLRCNGR